MKATYNEIDFTEADVVNLDDWVPTGEHNPNYVKPWLLHDHGFVLAVVFADSLQNALDIAVDAGKLDRYVVSQEEFEERTAESDRGTLDYLGNECKPFDIESLGVVELPNPPRSFVAQFNARPQNG